MAHHLHAPQQQRAFSFSDLGALDAPVAAADAMVDEGFQRMHHGDVLAIGDYPLEDPKGGREGA